jgi:uncharacterized DUF497 family protein
MKYNWNKEKNELLKRERNVSFEDVLVSIQHGGLLGIEPHYNTEQYGHQSIIFVNINQYVYLVPYVYDAEKDEAFLKTIIPSRKHTKKFKDQV